MVVEQLSEHVLQGKNESFESACRKRVFAKQLSEHVLHGENESGAEWLLNNSLSMSYTVRMSLARSGC